MALPSPQAEAIAKLKAQVEARLSQSHEDRINQLASRLQTSLLSPFDKAACAEVLPQTVSAGAAALADPMSQVRLSEVFDELLASDQANRMHHLNQEVTFRERELQRLREALERAQLEASWSKQKHEATEAQFTKVSSNAALLESELRKLQQENQALGQQVQGLTSAKAAAERAAAVGETRAATAEALLSSRTQELEQLQTHFKRLTSDQQAELDRLRQQVQSQASELLRSQSEAATREQGLVKELQAANSSLVDVKTALAAERSTSEMLQGKVAELSADIESGRKAKQQLQAQLQQVEGLLADSEAERRSVRAKYMNLGDKLEGMLAEEAKQQKASAAQTAALQQQLREVQQAALMTQQELSHTAAQLSEAQQALVDADKLHAKAVRKLDKRLQQLAVEYDGARQDLLIKSAEILDLQAQMKEVEMQHQLQLAAAQDQADLLQNQVAQLQQQLQQAADREQHVKQEAVAAAEDRLELELRQQQLKYERQIQELELHSRYVTALDALSNPNALAARQVLDHTAAASAGGADNMGLGLGSDGGVSLDMTGSRSRFDAFDARLRRTLTEHVSRAEAVEAMESRLLSVKKELSADYKRRLDTLEAEWASRAAARTAEMEGTHALKLQQVELTARLENERLEARVADLTATKQSLEQQLAASKQEVTRLSREASEARVQAEEARVGRQLLQTQLEEANSHLKQLQGVIDKYSGGTKGDREVITDLMTRLEARTAERNEALQAAAAADARLKVLESEKLPLQQRQMQQAVDTAEAGRAAAEAKLKAAVAGGSEAAAAAEATQSASARQLKRLQEERQKLEDSLEEVTAARSSLERQLNLSQAEARSLASRLKETSQALALLQEDHTAQEAQLARLRDEKQQLLASNTDLESVRAQLSSDVVKSCEEQRRLSLMVQGLEMSKAGLQRRLSVAAAERQSAVRTSELRASTPSPTRSSIVSGLLGSDMRATITTLPPTSAAAAAAAVAADSGLPYRDSFTAAAISGGGAGENSGGGSPIARHASGSFAFQMRPSLRVSEAVDMGGLSAAHASYSMQDLEGLLAQFDEERRLMLQRYDVLEAENSSLRQQLATATVRASELSMSNEQLLKSLERHRGALEVESKAAQELADKVLSDVQRSSSDMAQLNSWLQSELDAARRGHKEALEATSTAEKKAIVLEAKISELQRAAAAAAKEAEEKYNTHLSKLEVSSNMQISSMKSKLAVLKEDLKMQLTAAAKEEAQKIADLGDRHVKELQQQKDAAAAASEAAAAEHSKQVAQLQQLLKDQEAASTAQATDLQQQLTTLQEQMAAVARLLLAVLQVPQQQQQQQEEYPLHQQQQQFAQQQQHPGMGSMGGMMQPYHASPHKSQQQQQQQPLPVSPGRASMVGPGSPSRFSASPGRNSKSPSAAGYMQQPHQQYQQPSHQHRQQPQQYQQPPQQFGQHQPEYGSSNGYAAGLYLNQLQHGQSAVAAGYGPLPLEAVELSAKLMASMVTDSSAEPSVEDAAGALQVLVQGLCQQLQALNQQLADAQQENDQLVMDASALASDLQMCATNLQSLVATVAFTIPLGEDVQQGLNAKDLEVFDEQLAALHEAIKNHVESEKQQVSAALHAGPIADLQQQLETAHAALAEATGTIKQMKTERQEEISRFEHGLNRARTEAADGAELARKESLGGLKAELQQMKAQLSQLQDAHSSELGSVQEASARQLAAHVKSADAIIKELESTANNLQTQLALEVERADAYSKELKRVHADKERQLQLDARKERRATGEIEGLRERLRTMESREKEKEDEMKQLKRNLRQKELSLLSSGATSIVDK